MSVLHLLGSSRDGGAETYFVSLVGALARSGLSQSAAIRAHAGRERALSTIGVPTRVLPFAALDLRTGPAIRRLTREQGARVQLQWMNRAGRVAPGRGPWTRIGRLGGYYDLKYYRGCDLLVGNTQGIVDYVVREGWPAARALYIPNFAAPGPELAQSRLVLGTPEHAPLLLAMGRLHPAKAHDVSLRALVDLPEAWLWVAGSGPLEGELERLARELGVSDRVRFLGWREDASALYRAADVCVFPSRYEPLGNTVIQAWAHDVPVVAAASAGPASLITDGEDGLLTPIDDAGELAAAVRRVLAEPELAPRLAEAGRARVATAFSEAAVVAQWRELFARYGEG